jgi:hydrogenase expression/formation protein HypE
MEPTKNFGLSCPIPISEYPQILLAHGGGGKLMHQLIEKLFIPAFQNEQLLKRHDGAILDIGGIKLAFTTDSYVVQPLFFPGGDIGTLAINGTANDLAMCGAKPLFLSAGMIIEEGLPVDTLWKIVQSMKEAAEYAQVELVTGDTKVVDKGKGDGIFINTAGIGIVQTNVNIDPKRIEPGDAILINGDIGRHGIAVIAKREELAFEVTIESDCACLSGLVMEIMKSGVDIHCMRDLTRGGLATSLVEIADASRRYLQIYETKIVVDDQVHGACEMLGFDPLYVANEGRFVCFVAQTDVSKVLEIMQSHELGKNAAIIGEVADASQGGVTMINRVGTRRIIEMLSGQQLPRIC